MMNGAIMTKKPNVSANVLLFRYFEDYGISLKEVAKKTGYKVNYLKNLRSGSNDISDAAKFRFIINFPDTMKFFLPEKKED